MPKKVKKIKKIKKNKKFKVISFKPEKIDYSKVKHETSVDQSDRQVPYNLRQSGPTKVELLISTRVRKSLTGICLCKQVAGEQQFIIEFIILEDMSDQKKVEQW